MKIAAIVLFVLQALGILGGIVGGSSPILEFFSGIAAGTFSIPGLAELIGYFSPTIIGIILLVVAKKRGK